MWLLLFLLFLPGCKKNPLTGAQTNSLILSGETGRNLTIQVVGLERKRSKTNVHRACAIGLAGNENLKKDKIDEKLTCSTELKPDGTLSLELKHLPYPAYVILFHDENLNSALDFASFNIVIAKRQGPIEGVGTLQGADPEMKFSRPIWVEVGNTQTVGHITYERGPLWRFVSDQIWQVFYSWYLEKAYQVNHPGKEKNPYCTKAEDCL